MSWMYNILGFFSNPSNQIIISIYIIYIWLCIIRARCTLLEIWKYFYIFRKFRGGLKFSQPPFRYTTDTDDEEVISTSYFWIPRVYYTRNRCYFFYKIHFCFCIANFIVVRNNLELMNYLASIKMYLYYYFIFIEIQITN